MSSTRRLLSSLPPTESLDLQSGLSLHPRLKLLLTFFRSDLSVKPVDEWQLKRALFDFVRDSLNISVSEDVLTVRKQSDLHKRKREESVAFGTLYVRDLGFLKKMKRYEDDSGDDCEVLKKKFVEWKEDVVRKTDGIELNLQGVKFRLKAEVPLADDFDRLRRDWEEFYSWKPSGNRYSGGVARRPDTVIVKGVPSRWFAETRVSSKPSMLVTHTIFSVLGKIRNINVTGDDDLGKTTEENKGNIVPGLHCKIWVQFENYDDFCGALTALSSRSLLKEGSRLIADYEVSWDRDGFFRNMPHRMGGSQIQARVGQDGSPLKHHKMETSRFQPYATRFNSDGYRSRRFRLILQMKIEGRG